MSRRKPRSGPHHDANVAAFFGRRFGIQFADHEMLIRAVTHTSFAEEASEELPHNQRLEFLGDSVVGIAVTHALYLAFPGEPEGALSKLKARIVSTSSLAAAARRNDLGRFLRLGRGEERTSGREKTRLLADVFESVAGAIFLDQGFEPARAWVLRLLQPELEKATPGRRGGDFKSELQEHLQGSLRTRPKYITLGAEGPAHEQVFTVAVNVDGEQIASGTGRSKKEAQQAAAQAALQALTIPEDETNEGTKHDAAPPLTPSES